MNVTRWSAWIEPMSIICEKCHEVEVFGHLNIRIITDTGGAGYMHQSRCEECYNDALEVLQTKHADKERV